METSEPGGHRSPDTHSTCAADGAGQRGRDTHRGTARPELIGGHCVADTQVDSAADGDERAYRAVNPSGNLPAVADFIESETGGGHPRVETHPTRAATNGGGHVGVDSHRKNAPADPTSSGQLLLDAHCDHAAAGDEAGQVLVDIHGVTVGLIAELIAQHRQREGLHRAEKSLTLQIKANCRWLCKGDKTAANALYKAMMNGAADPLVELFWGANLPFINARNQIEPERLKIEKRMEAIAAQFPVAEWWCEIKGRNLLGLAQLIGETGDLSNYANPAKLWARFCVDVEDGEAKKRRRGVANGYNAARRSVSWRIADSLFKGQSARVDKETGEIKREAGPYRVLYDERKAKEVEKAIEEGLEVRPSARIPKAKASEYRSEGHIHKRSLRYMEKRLLKHLWQAWREARSPMIPTE